MTRFYRLVAFLTIVLPTSLAAQEKVSARPIPMYSAPSLSHVFKKYALFEINTTAMTQFVKQTAAQGDIQLELDLPGYTSFPIKMHEHDILSSDYKLVVGTPQGRQEFSRPDCMTYTGELTNQGGSGVYLTLTNDLIYGLLKGSNTSWFIEPLQYFDKQAKGNIYVIYETRDVLPRTGFSCGVTEVMTRRITDNNTARVEGTAVGTCKMVEVALASDHTMMGRYTTATRVQEHNIAVMNTMVGLYSNAQIGTQYLEFKINGQYVSTAEANNSYSPAYTGSDATILLPRFRTWGQAGNFGFTYDMAVVWTTKDITDSGGGTGVIGLAYVGTVCGSSRYQILEDVLGFDGASLGTLAAHETGHNFNAGHDASGDPYIMAPSLSSPPNTSFSPTSLTVMDTYINANGSCLGACNVIMPVAQFNASAMGICTGNSVTFTDYSVGQVTGVSWTFQDGTPATSTDRAPSVTFSTSGLKAVTLTATNVNGTNSVTKNIFVANALTGTGCRTTFAGSADYGLLNSFMVQDISHAVSVIMLGTTYNNYSCTNNTVLQPGTTYTATANLGLLSLPTYDIFSKIQVFIDYNNDGDVLDTDEAVYTSAACHQGVHEFTFTTPPAIVVMDAYLRMRVVGIACSAANTNGCAVPTRSHTEDYAVYFSSSAILPILLTGFDGFYSNGKNELNWQTETEVNTDHFIIERSIDGSNYTEVGKVLAKGLSSARTNSYQLTDALLAVQNANRFYYRLKIVAKDGSYKYSKLVITTKPTGDNVQVVVYPNPVLRNTTLQIKKATNNKSVIEIFNSMGQQVYGKQMTASQYNVSVDIPANWSPGVYMIRVSDSKESWSRAVMIK